MNGFEVEIPSGDGAPATPAFAAVPEGAKRGVVIIHEIFGRQPEIDRVVLKFAEKGYAAVAPDLFARGTMRCLIDFYGMMKNGRGVPAAQGRNARAWLRERAGIPIEMVGLIGFCFGGGYALAAGSGWAAVSTNYGPVPDEEVLRGIGKVIGCYGSRDRGMAKMPGRLRERLARIGHEPAEIHTFDAKHSFLTDAPVTFVRGLFGVADVPEAREAGWKVIFEFFDRALRV